MKTRFETLYKSNERPEYAKKNDINYDNTKVIIHEDPNGEYASVRCPSCGTEGYIKINKDDNDNINTFAAIAVLLLHDKCNLSSIGMECEPWISIFKSFIYCNITEVTYTIKELGM